MTRILWLARTLPVPLNAGDRVYTARLVEAIGRAGARVDFFGHPNPEAPEIGAEILDPAVAWQVVPGGPRPAWRALLGREPLVGGRFGTPAYRALVARQVASGDYDAVVIDQYGLAWALDVINRGLRAARKRPLLVHLSHDFETDVTAGIARDFTGDPLRRLALRRNAAKTARAERRLANRCGLVIALTEHDAGMFRAINPRQRFVVVPPGYSGPRADVRRITAATPRRVAIVGSYRWIAKAMNLAAFLEVADPQFAAAGIELIVIGDAPDDFRTRWEPRLKASRFLGFVDDLAATLADCRMGLVVEATGGGFKLKVLDYVFTRTPVAALRPSLGGQPQELVDQFIVAPDAAALAQAVIAAIDDVARLDAMQDRAIAVAAPLFDWDVNAARVLAAIGEAA